MITMNEQSAYHQTTPDRHGNQPGEETTIRLDRSIRDAIIRLAEALRRGGGSPESPTRLLSENASNQSPLSDHSEVEGCEIEYASDPIPANAIRLTDAFHRVLDANVANPKLLRLEEDERQEIRTSTDADLRRYVGEDYPPEDLECIVQGKEANVFLRKCLAAGELVPCVRDPETGEILQLTHKGWENLEFVPGELGWLESDHVHPDDPFYPGPADVMVRGKARPVFLRRDEFERWFQKTFGPRGRPRGSGSLAKADGPLVEEMHQLIESGSAKSAEDAAGKLADGAAGGGTLQSKVTRLARRYRKQFPPERN
jgi:hypothetical protein